MKISKCVGIDLGTTNSVISMMSEDNREILCLTSRHGSKTYPSVVAYNAQTKKLITGQGAYNMIGKRDDTVSSIKRRMGDNAYTVKIGDAELTPPEVSACILRDMKSLMQEYLATQPGYADYVVDRAIITVPAYFASNAREATTEAARLAGLEVEMTLQEPTASAMYYCYKNNITDGIFMVYDLGGGTFDVSIVRMSGNKPDVVGIAGNNYLGGDNLDEALAYQLLEIAKDPEFNYDLSFDLKKDTAGRRALTRMKIQAEIIKKQLSTNIEHFAYVPELCTDVNGTPVSLQAVITREMFEPLIQPLLMTTLEECDRALAEAKKEKGITLDMIDAVLLVGGSTYTPLVKELIRQKYTDPSLPMHTISPEPLINEPDMAVGFGAAIAASSYAIKHLADDVAVPSAGGSGARTLSLSVSFQPGVFAAVGKSNVHGVLSTNAGQPLPSGIVAKVRRADEAFEGEFPVEKDGSFVFARLPAREGHEPFSCTFMLEGTALLTSPFNVAVSETTGAPVTLSRDYFILVTDPNTNEKSLFPLMKKGTPLPFSQDFVFGAINPNYAKLEFFEETLMIKEVTIHFNPPVVKGTPIKLSIACDKKSVFSALATSGNVTQQINFEPSPPPSMPTELELRQVKATFTGVLPTLQPVVAIVAEKKVERLIGDVQLAVDEGDSFKAADKMADLRRFVNGLIVPPNELTPSQPEFAEFAAQCDQKNETLNKDKKEAFDNYRRQINDHRTKGTACYQNNDQAQLTQAYEALVKIDKLLKPTTKEPEIPEWEQCKFVCRQAYAIISQLEDHRDLPKVYADKRPDMRRDKARAESIFNEMQFERNLSVVRNRLVEASGIARRWDEVRKEVNAGGGVQALDTMNDRL